ncbi:hypothetical protein V8D89_016293 [Ganoderma adspersum]
MPTRGSVLVKRVPDKPPSHQDDNNDEEDLVKSLLHVTVNTKRKNNPPDYIGNTTYHMSMSSVWHAIYIKSKRGANWAPGINICISVLPHPGSSIYVLLNSGPLIILISYGTTHTVISGSFALQFLDATYYPNSDLNLYILPNDTLLVLGAYLLCQGYIYVPKEWQQEDFLEDTQHVQATLDVIPDIENKDTPNYRSKSIHEDVCSVQVIVPRVSPLYSILAFHSTCVMNIITYNAAFLLYPYAMFNRRESLTLDMKMHPAEVQDKYTKRGWTMLANLLLAHTPHTLMFPSSPPILAEYNNNKMPTTCIANKQKQYSNGYYQTFNTQDKEGGRREKMRCKEVEGDKKKVLTSKKEETEWGGGLARQGDNMQDRDEENSVETKAESHGTRIILWVHGDAVVDQDDVSVLEILALQPGQLESVLDSEDTITEVLAACKLGTCIPDGN